MFLHLSVILFTGRGCLPLVLGGVCHTLPSRHPLDRHPQADTPLGRHAPGETPPGHTTPPGRHLLPSACWDTPPLCSACWDMVNRRAVHILLECILVIHSITKHGTYICRILLAYLSLVKFSKNMSAYLKKEEFSSGGEVN